MTRIASPARLGNRLLDLLSDKDRAAVAGSLEEHPLEIKQRLGRANEPAGYVYFPTAGMISSMITLADGNSVEVSTIGNEGMAGYALLLGLETHPFDLIAQVAGASYRMPGREFLRHAERLPVFGAVVRRYAAVAMRLSGQVIACNALHPIGDRMCRWLLATHDRAGADEFVLTQEFLADMLGVRRQSVTVTAGMLQQAGLITYRRGLVRINDRTGLEEASCECYAAMQEFSRRMLGDSPFGKS